MSLSEPSPAPLLISGKDAARSLSISPRKLWELTNSGAIASVRIGRSVRYDLRDVKAFIHGLKKGGRR